MVRLADLDPDLQRRVLAQDRAAAREAILALDRLPPPKERSPMREKEWQSKYVIPWATALGWWVYHPFLSKFSQRGWPDLSMIRGERVLYAELKPDDRTITEEQAKVITMLRAAGQEVHIWRPATGEDAILEALR